ncbi:CAAX amino terminal protease family protein [Legionella geestiana]|uniref:CAAX amino terminal protease family protein n=2 Tax=Legionella geestiana TaxID=45065 RepID=A0A0W0U5K8_9GAMM|nr:CAAX amino terminal protease family protein [Legionella geestiana]STX53621.1 CAAX amino terminal protease family protein [Legionella geestiana]
MVRASGYPLSYYGFRADNLYRNLSEAILFSIPVMLIVVMIKWLIISMDPALNHIPMIDIASIFENGAPFSLRIYLLSMIAYALFCPVQEFLARGCVQTSLQHLFEGSETQIKWKSIVVSNLIFASAHSHTGADFALFVFLPGLFWGWMFYRQKSLIGVSVSHTLIGVWATFIIGIERVI